jgi:hypothetical protein
MKKPLSYFLALSAAALLMGGCASQSHMSAGSGSWPAPPAEGPYDESSDVMPLTAGARPSQVPLVAGGYEQPY